MIVKHNNISYPCSKAIKDKEISLYNSDGVLTNSFIGFEENLDDFVLEGGAWSYPEPTQQQIDRADIDYLLMLAGE